MNFETMTTEERVRWEAFNEEMDRIAEAFDLSAFCECGKPVYGEGLCEKHLIAALRQQADTLKKALEWYAAEDNYSYDDDGFLKRHSNADEDHGERARAALAAVADGGKGE